MSTLLRRFTTCELDNPRLSVDIIPSTSLFTDLKHKVSAAQWKTIEESTFKFKGLRCEICGGRGNQHPVECHEEWHFDEIKKIQKLIATLSLCPKCHEVKHITHTEHNERYEEILEHLAYVNGWDTITAAEYLNQAFDQKEYRSQFDWKVDISIINSLIEPHEIARKTRVEQLLKNGDIFGF